MPVNTENTQRILATLRGLIKEVKKSDLQRLHIEVENEILEMASDTLYKNYEPTGYHTLTIRYYIPFKK